MLAHPTLDQLHALGLQGMAKAFTDMAGNDDAGGLGHADWLALLLDREAVYRQDRRLGARLRHARLRHQAVPEDIDYRASRSLDRQLLKGLLEGKWIDRHDNLAIVGATELAS
jgi:DNA replication protein DnaC